MYVVCERKEYVDKEDPENEGLMKHTPVIWSTRTYACRTYEVEGQTVKD